MCECGACVIEHTWRSEDNFVELVAPWCAVPSCCCDETLYPKDNLERKVHMAHTFRSLSVLSWGESGRNLKQRPWKNTTFWLNHRLMLSGLGPATSVNSKDSLPQACAQVRLLQPRLPSRVTLGYVKLTVKAVRPGGFWRLTRVLGPVPGWTILGPHLGHLDNTAAGDRSVRVLILLFSHTEHWQSPLFSLAKSCAVFWLRGFIYLSAYLFIYFGFSRLGFSV